MTITTTWKRAMLPVGASDRNALELSASASSRLGPVSTRVTLVWSPDLVGGTEGSFYVEAGASFAVGPSTSLSAIIGRRDRDGGPDYTAFQHR